MSSARIQDHFASLTDPRRRKVVYPNLMLHPHVHCVVSGGGLAPDESRWVAGRDDFFLPVRVLSRVFRGKFLAGLRAAFRQGRLDALA
jgi:hypothetical protein